MGSLREKKRMKKKTEKLRKRNLNQNDIDAPAALHKVDAALAPALRARAGCRYS